MRLIGLPAEFSQHTDNMLDARIVIIDDQRTQ